MKTLPFEITDIDTPLLDMYVFGKPQAWQRVSFGKFGQSYVPKETRDWQKHIGKTAMVSTLRRVIDAPLIVRLDFYLEPPKKPQWWRPAVTPDLDNLSKSVLDGLEKANIIKNDSRVVTLILRKYYAYPDSERQPGVRVVVGLEDMSR